MKGRLADLAAGVRPGSPADFGLLIAEETEKWAKVIRAASVAGELPIASNCPTQFPKFTSEVQHLLRGCLDRRGRLDRGGPNS
jgi:hypothetical protein